MDQGEHREVTECTDVNCEICRLEDSIANGWMEYLNEEPARTKLQTLKTFLHAGEFYPQANQIFAFTRYKKLKDIKVVIIGQDPYPQEGHATGLCFSIPNGIEINDSLRNIFKELKKDITGFEVPASGDLTKWAREGVLLLNCVLTTEPNITKSHYDKGWEVITDQIVRSISLKGKNVVFMLWGEKAHKKLTVIENPTNHKILKCSHPSPLSATRGPFPFVGCKHFSQANKYLKERKKIGIDWKLCS